MHPVCCALFGWVYIISFIGSTCLIYPYSSELFQWYWDNQTIASGLILKDGGKIDLYLTTTKHNGAPHVSIFLRRTVLPTFKEPFKFKHGKKYVTLDKKVIMK